MEWCVDRAKMRIAGENTLRRMRTRYVACGWGCPCSYERANARGGRSLAHSEGVLGRCARKHAHVSTRGVLPAHGNKQPIDRYRVAQNLMEHGHGERE